MRIRFHIEKRLHSQCNDFALNCSLETEDDSLVLFGPSGSGKTLTLTALAGLMRPDAGFIEINGRVLFDSNKNIDLPARQRKLGYVFQDYALFPHLNIRDNIGFALAKPFRGMSQRDANRVDDLLDLFGLSELALRSPRMISGGQKQRVALARALASQPEALLLDEPFSALDQPLRKKMRNELSKAAELFDIPIIMVTHDIVDVEELGKSVAVYRHGQIVRHGAVNDVAGEDWSGLFGATTNASQNLEQHQSQVCSTSKQRSHLQSAAM